MVKAGFMHDAGRRERPQVAAAPLTGTALMIRLATALRPSSGWPGPARPHEKEVATNAVVMAVFRL